MIHAVPSCAQLRSALRDLQQLLALAGLETTFDTEEASLKQATDLVLNGCAFAGQAARRLLFGRRATAFQLRLGLGETVALSRDGTQDALGQFLEDMEGTNLMGNVTKDGAERRGIERRAIGGDALEAQVAIGHCRLQALEKGGDVVMGGIMIENLIEHPFVAALVDN